MLKSILISSLFFVATVSSAMCAWDAQREAEAMAAFDWGVSMSNVTSYISQDQFNSQTGQGLYVVEVRDRKTNLTVTYELNMTLVEDYEYNSYYCVSN